MRYPTLQASFISWRFYFVNSIILLTVAGLIGRMVDLAVVKRVFLLDQGNARAVRVISEPAFRGMIMDRNGYPLAVSTSVYSVWINPKEFSLNTPFLPQLSQLVSMKPKALYRLVQRYKNKNREFVYVKRELSPQIANTIKSFKIPGLYLQQEYKRFYPEGEVTAHVIGFTNVDDQGQEGLELAYNNWLVGMPGKKLVVKDRKGQVISDIKMIHNQVPGHDLILSINRRIQYLAYRELLEGVEKNIASAGSVVVLDVKTGEILAMVNQPSFNPNHILPNEKASFRNKAVTDSFEPGSTIKAFSIASALDSGKFKPDTIIDTNPGWMRVGHHLVQDEHNKGALSVTEILQYSSNVGVAKMLLSLPTNQLPTLLHHVGFGELTGVGFPGEQTGKITPQSSGNPFGIATLAFGYGISVTALQLAHAYATLANHGETVPLSLVRVETAPKGKPVMNPHVADQMLTLLESVVVNKGATGRSARISGYHIAGKTGTAKITSPEGGYEKKHYVSSFIGIAPVTHPRLVVAVIIRDPKGKVYYGGDVSGPVFERIMEGALAILNIPPDDMASLNQDPKTK